MGHARPRRRCTSEPSRISRQPDNKNQAAGLTLTAEPARKEVTAACEPKHTTRSDPLPRTPSSISPTSKSNCPSRPSSNTSAWRRSCAAPAPKTLRLPDPSRRRPRPHLQRQPRCKTSSTVSKPRCQKKGDVIDLWAALHQQDLRQAALDLVHTFDLEPAQATEKRHG